MIAAIENLQNRPRNTTDNVNTQELNHIVKTATGQDPEIGIILDQDHNHTAIILIIPILIIIATIDPDQIHTAIILTQVKTIHYLKHRYTQ